MAYYDDGKITFLSVIKQVDNPIGKKFLKYLKRCWYDGVPENKCFIEQLLYNRSSEEIYHELIGFVAGITYGKLKWPDVETVMVGRSVMPKLAQIYIDMVKENNFDNDDSVENWKDHLH